MPSVVMTLEAAAKRIKAEVVSAGSIRFWGANLFRPSDVVYQVAGATVTDGKILRVHLYLDLDRTAPLLELESPAGIQVADGNLIVKSALRVRWDGKEKDAPASGTSEPALFLGD